MRNPKDTAVSGYHHHRKFKELGPYTGSWANYAKLFAKGQLVNGDWYEHVVGYWNLAREQPNRVLFIAYEELHSVGISIEFLSEVHIKYI